MMVWPLSLLCAGLLAGLSVLIHYECLNGLQGLVTRLGSARARIVSMMIGLLIAHVVEIWLYAGAYQVLTLMPEFGTIQASSGSSHSIFDLVYFSAMVYTTVGFGDMVPSGGIRLVTATEALVGLSLIAWSASFTYFQMQRQFDSELD